MFTVTSWFVDQIYSPVSSPVRKFYIGASDYSSEVTKWPSIKLQTELLRSATVTIGLNNSTGALNMFFYNKYTMQSCCTLKIGFTHPDSGDELITLFTGGIKDIAYPEIQCDITLRDKLFSFTEKTIGSTNSGGVVVFSAQIPSDIFWTCCTCYGGLSTAQSVNNPDIDWTDFQSWAAQFSADSITNAANFQGVKITEAVKKIINMNDSVAWSDNIGKIHVAKFSDPSSNTFLVTRDMRNDLFVEVNGEIINKFNVFYNYSVASNYWQNNLIHISSTSQMSFGTHEQILSDSNVWFTNSQDANNLADRVCTIFAEPYRKFTVQTPFFSALSQVGDTVRLVDSFFNVTSESGWRISEIEVKMKDFEVKFVLDETATAANAIYLDISKYDGPERLL